MHEVLVVALAAATISGPPPQHHGAPLLIPTMPTRAVAREAHRVGREVAELNDAAWWTVPVCWHTHVDGRRTPWRCLLRVAAGPGTHCDAVLRIRRERILDTRGRLVRVGRRMTTQHVRSVGCYLDNS